MQLATQAGQQNRSDDGAQAQAAVEQAVRHGAGLQVLLRHHGEECPHRAGESREQERAQQNRAQRRGVADVAHAAPHGPEDSLGGKRAFEERRPLPRVENEDHRQEGDGIQQKDYGRAHADRNEGGHGEASEGRAYGARQIESRTVERDRVGQFVARHQFGDDRLPGGIVHRAADIQQEGEHQECGGRDDSDHGQDAQHRHRGQHPGLPEDQQAAAVEDVRGSAGGKSEEEYRKAGRGLHERDQQRRRGQRGHQPRARGILHPASEVGDDRGDPAIAKEGPAEGRPSGRGFDLGSESHGVKSGDEGAVYRLLRGRRGAGKLWPRSARCKPGRDGKTAPKNGVMKA